MRRLTAGRSLLAAAAAAVALVTGCSSGSASSPAAFPEAGSTVEWIVPSAPGAANDILARVVAPAMQTDLGANVRVVNKEGGSQVIGLDYAAKSDPDGHTLVYTNVPSILGRYLDPSKKASFDRSSFTPIGSFASNSVVVGVNKNSPYTSITQLIDAVKAAPGSVTVGTDSRAGDDHVNLRTMERDLGVDFNIVHYNSGADKITALLSGEVDFAIGGVGSFYGPFKAGDVRLLSVVQDQPNSLFPEVPTMSGAGYAVAPMTNNFAVSVPAGTPAETVSRLSAALQAAANDPAVHDKLVSTGAEPVWVSGPDVAALWEQREKALAPVIAELLQEQA